MKKIFLLVFAFLFLVSMSSVKGNAVSIAVTVPAWSNWTTASTKYKSTFNEQSVEYVYSSYNRNICTDVTNDEDGTSYIAHCGEIGDTKLFDDQLHKVGNSTYTLYARTQYVWFNKTSASMIWYYD